HVRRHGGATTFQRLLDQPAERHALRRRRSLRTVRDLRLESPDRYFVGDIGEYGVDIPGDEDLQLRAVAQLGKSRVEEGASALEHLTYAPLVRHLRAEFYRQDPCPAHKLLDHSLMADQQAPQIIPAAAFQVRSGTVADDRAIPPAADRAHPIG